MAINTNIQTLERPTTLVDNSGNSKLIEILSRWGVNLYAGVNGGGIIHVAKHLLPFEGLHQANDGIPRLFDVPESIASNIPIGYHFATGKVAASISTTAGATLYGMLGLANAKMHDVPYVGIFALNSTKTFGKGPLQDMTPDGMNSVAMIRAMVGDNCLIIDDVGGLEKILARAQDILHQSKPVALMFHPDILSQEINGFNVPWANKPREVNNKDLSMFLRYFPEETKGRRVIIYAGEEAARYEGIQALTTSLSTLLKAPVIYSMNSVSAVAHNNPYAAGYIHLGFNDWTKKLWDGLSEKDVAVFLGFDPGEYELNLSNVKADVWHFTNFTNPYGSKNGDFRHRVEGKYRQVKGSIALSLEYLIPKLKENIEDRPNFFDIPQDLNTREIEEPKPGNVDLVKFYREFVRLVRPGTFIVNDVSQAYKDFQYVTQRPILGVKVWQPHRVSTMGDTFGVSVGLKIGDPNLHPHIFVGDGCFKYFSGALVNAQNLGITVWVMDNGMYHIISKGLEVVMPKVERKRHHSKLQSVDFVKVAEAHGWDAYNLRPDLKNLEEIMTRVYSDSNKSVLVRIPVDGDVVIGQNPRLLGLRAHGVQTYL